MTPKEYYQKNREKILNYHKKWEKEHYTPEKRNQKYIKNRKRVTQQVRTRRELNPEKVHQEQRDCYNNHKDVILSKRKEQRKRFPVKFRCRDIFKQSIKLGKIIRPKTCESCKKQIKVQGHHFDYSKPLDV